MAFPYFAAATKSVLTCGLRRVGSGGGQRKGDGAGERGGRGKGQGKGEGEGRSLLAGRQEGGGGGGGSRANKLRVLLLWGEDDTTVPADSMPEWIAFLDRGVSAGELELERRSFANAAHCFFLERADEVHAVLGAFLDCKE